jgi:hypothetical protein
MMEKDVIERLTKLRDELRELIVKMEDAEELRRQLMRRLVDAEEQLRPVLQRIGAVISEADEISGGIRSALRAGTLGDAAKPTISDLYHDVGVLACKATDRILRSTGQLRRQN